MINAFALSPRNAPNLRVCTAWLYSGGPQKKETGVVCWRAIGACYMLSRVSLDDSFIQVTKSHANDDNFTNLACIMEQAFGNLWREWYKRRFGYRYIGLQVWPLEHWAGVGRVGVRWGTFDDLTLNGLRFEASQIGLNFTKTLFFTKKKRGVARCQYKLVGGFKYFLFSPLFGEDSHF